MCYTHFYLMQYRAQFHKPVSDMLVLVFAINLFPIFSLSCIHTLPCYTTRYLAQSVYTKCIIYLLMLFVLNCFLFYKTTNSIHSLKFMLL